MKLVISGIGPLSPLGAGRECLWQSLSEGHSGIKEISRFSSIPGAMGGEIIGVEIDDIVDDRKFRRAADVSKYAMAAIKLAITDAGLESVKGEDSAIVTAVTHGALNYTQEYHESLLTGDVEDISPILFSDSVLNAPAGNASICFGIQGAVHTIVGGTGASVKAAILAGRLMGEGRVKRAIVVSAEELNELSFYCRSKLGEPVLSEGAGAILIEGENARENTNVYCYISGFASHLNPEDREASLKTSIDKALAMAGIEKQDLNFVLSDVPPVMDTGYLNGLPSDTVSRYYGKAFCVSSMWNIIAAAYIIKQGVLPDYFMMQRKEKVSVKKIKNVLVCTLEKTGSAAAMILSK
jgi:3-oxoacyl-(acyl-carrier-protein) synthase